MQQPNTDTHLLFIEPTGAPSAVPVIDDLTRKLTGAWRERETSRNGWRGIHTCTGAGCAAMSDNTEHWLRVRDDRGVERLVVTNSMCIHYLAFHRAEVPQAQLDLVAQLVSEPAEPTAGEMGSDASESGRREALERRSGLTRPTTY